MSLFEHNSSADGYATGNNWGVLAYWLIGREIVEELQGGKERAAYGQQVLDFLGLPEADTMRESDLESAIIGNLQTFLLELGKGFAFVARQKRIGLQRKPRCMKHAS